MLVNGISNFGFEVLKEKGSSEWKLFQCVVRAGKVRILLTLCQ